MKLEWPHDILIPGILKNKVEILSTSLQFATI